MKSAPISLPVELHLNGRSVPATPVIALWHETAWMLLLSDADERLYLARQDGTSITILHGPVDQTATALKAIHLVQAAAGIASPLREPVSTTTLNLALCLLATHAEQSGVSPPC